VRDNNITQAMPTKPVHDSSANARLKSAAAQRGGAQSGDANGRSAQNQDSGANTKSFSEIRNRVRPRTAKVRTVRHFIEIGAALKVGNGNVESVPDVVQLDDDIDLILNQLNKEEEEERINNSNQGDHHKEERINSSRQGNHKRSAYFEDSKLDEAAFFITEEDGTGNGYVCVTDDRSLPANTLQETLNEDNIPRSYDSNHPPPLSEDEHSRNRKRGRNVYFNDVENATSDSRNSDKEDVQIDVDSVDSENLMDLDRISALSGKSALNGGMSFVANKTLIVARLPIAEHDTEDIHLKHNHFACDSQKEDGQNKEYDEEEVEIGELI